VSLFFSDVYKKVPEFKRLSDFAKKVRNIFGSVRHSPSAMFKKYTRLHNKGIHLGFIKPSECRMAGEHIALLRLMRLKNALRATITSKEFIELRVFHYHKCIDESRLLAVPFCHVPCIICTNESASAG